MRFSLLPSRAATFDKKQMWPVCGSFAVIAAAASVYGELVVAPQSRISTSRQPLLFNQELLYFETERLYLVEIDKVY